MMTGHQPGSGLRISVCGRLHCITRPRIQSHREVGGGARYDSLGPGLKSVLTTTPHAFWRLEVLGV